MASVQQDHRIEPRTASSSADLMILIVIAAAFAVLHIATNGRYGFHRDELQAIPAVLELVLAQHGRIPMAVVSGSRRASVVGSLTALAILQKFDTLVCAEDYQHGKPAPDCFLLAAERLGVPPASCLVFEDTDLGIQAATAAGMASVRVPQIRPGTGTASGA